MKLPKRTHRLHGLRSGLLLSLSLSVVLGSAAPAPAQGKAPVPVLDLRWTPAKAGDSLALVVKVDLPRGWYINSHAPLDSFLVPTRLEASAPGLAFGPPRWPQPTVEHSDAMAGNMSLFKRDFEAVLQAAPVPPAGAAGKMPPARVTLHYQSCDGTMCWPPKTVSAVLRDGVTTGE